MARIGMTFSRDFEFTGCTEMSVGMQSRLLQNVMKKGFKINTIIGGPTSVLKDAGPYLKDIKPGTLTVELTEEQKKIVAQVLGQAPSKLRISIAPEEKAVEIPLTAEQKKSIESSLGIEIESISVKHEHVEVAMLP